MTPKHGPEHQAGLASRHLHQGDAALDQGALRAALGHFRRGLAVLRRLAQAEPSELWWQKQLARGQLRIGTVLLRQGKSAQAHACLEDSRALCLGALAASPGDHELRCWAATHLDRLGDAILQEDDDPERALEHHLTALELWRALHAEAPAEGYDADVAMTLVRVGSSLELQGDLMEALERFREALSIRQKHAEDAPALTGWQVAVAFTHARVAAVLEEQEDLEGALASHRSCLEILRRLVSAEPSCTDWQEVMAYTLKNIGDILQTTGTLQEALLHHEESAHIWSELMAAGHHAGELRRCLAITLEEIGDMRYGLDDLTGALRSCQESQRLWQQIIIEEPASPEWRERLGTCHMNVSDLMEELRDLAGALRSCQQAVAIRRRLVQEAPGHIGWQHDLAVSQERLDELTSRLMSPPEPETRVPPRSLH